MHLADRIESNLDALVEAFVREARKLESSEGLSEPELIDTLPEYLLTMAARLRTGTDPTPIAKERLQDTHIAIRLRNGYTEAEVLHEYVTIGRLVTSLWGRDDAPPAAEVDRFVGELEAAMAEVVSAFRGQTQDVWQREKRFVRRLEDTLPAALGPGDATSFAAALEPALDAIREAVEADVALLVFPGEDGALQLACAAVGACPMPSSLPAGGFLERAAVSDTPVRHVDAGPAGPLASLGVPSLVGLSLALGGRRGALVVGLRRIEPFGPNQLRLLERLARTLGLHLARALTVGELRSERENRERLVSILAHDIRGPLSATRAAAQLMLRSPDRARPDLLARIVDSVDRADRMLRDLLDVTRVRAGEPLHLQRVPCDLAALLREVADELATVHGERFVVDAPPALEGEWDGGQLRRAVWNLGANAVIHGGHEGPVTIRALPEGDAVRIEVHNLGREIPPAEQATLFRPFSRRPGADGRSGWGLGLALVKATAEAHGGDVGVESGAGRGTTFLLRLPRTPT